MDIYVSCGVWKSTVDKRWSFSGDANGGRLLSLESSITLNELRVMVLEDYEMEQSIASVRLSYIPADLFKNLQVPPVFITNDRQMKNFLGYAKKFSSTCLFVIFEATIGNQPSKVDIDHKKEASSEEFAKPTIINDNFKSNNNDVKVDGYCEMKKGSQKNVRFWMVDCVKKGELFKSKNVLQATLEICAMKHNFDYWVVKSDKTKWYVRCKDDICNWTVYASCLHGSTYFIVNKCVSEHTCAPSKRSNFGRTASAKTIGDLVMHKYEGVKEGSKPKDIIQFMRKEHGCEISYSLAWESREYAVASVRGIPEESFGKIPKYLHMLKESNPGTHTHYEADGDGRFKYLFLSFDQSIRGFFSSIRRVIVVDGTFLKSKYKGVLLVATAVDGNSNLYPIAFGVVDSENDSSWEWFLMQLKVVIADDQGLAFVSDRNSSIAKSLDIVYPQARHGICIHHLLNNVVTYFKKRGLVGLIEKASKAYRLVDFESSFKEICRMCPHVGIYLEEADVRKWGRCLFPGWRYDIRTTNPAESINAALRSPREYPVIPLLESIREMLTRCFYERRTLSSKQKDPLTIDVEKKVDRRIGKAKGFTVYPVNNLRFLVKGDRFDCLVDLDRRTCTCKKYDFGKIPCRHAIPAIFSRGMEVYRFTDAMYTTSAWRKAYGEDINPVDVPEDEWHVPTSAEDANVLPPETRRAAGRRRKRRHETVEDKIRSQGAKGSKKRKCGRCGIEGHNRETCDMPI